jgi:signal transduction histidine kinase
MAQRELQEQTRWFRYARYTTFGYLTLVSVVAVLASIFALQWLDRPFLGAFVEHTLVLNGVGPADHPGRAWELYRQEPHFGPRVIAINGEPIPDSRTFHQVLGRYFPGESVVVDLEYQDGGRQSYTVTLGVFPYRDFLIYFGLPFGLGLAFLITAWWVFAARRDDMPARIFAWTMASIGLIGITLFSVYTDHRLTYFWVLGLAIAPAAVLDLSTVFPQQARLFRRWPILRNIPYLLGLGLFVWTLPTLFNTSAPYLYAGRWRILYGFVGFGMGAFLLMQAFYAWWGNSPVVRAQARTVLAGTFLAFLPLGVWIGGASLSIGINFSPLLFLPLLLFPLTLGYSVLRYRLIRSDYLVSRALLFLLLSTLTVGGYAALVAGVGLLVRAVFDEIRLNIPLVHGLVIFLLAVLFEPLRVRLQQIVDRLFFRNQQVYEERLQQFSRDLTSALNLSNVTDLLRQQIVETLSPDLVHIFIFDPTTERYVAVPDEKGHVTSDLSFAKNSPLVQWLRNEKLPLYVVDLSFLPRALESMQTQFSLLQSILFIAIPGQDSLNGWVALGPRLSGEEYSSRDIAFVENLCAQVALAIDRVQSVNNLQRRLQELNALTRVAQGVNITLQFDDILELIYAQTYQIIPLDDLHITLYDQSGNYYYYAFCLENGDRLNEKENRRLPERHGLETWIVQSGQSIRTDNYLQACQEHDVVPAVSDVYAWMGVPLNTGSRTIGSLSVGSRDLNQIYTQSQLNTLTAIADLAAGAIVKSQLLAESERRTRQLTTLNQITQRLTSTLDLDQLLHTMLENAVQILNSEAGSLLLVDEETDELVFRVTYGPVAEDLRGMRISRDVGFVGRAVELRRPVIVNDVQRTGDIFSTIDDETGFVTKSLIAVPLIYQDNVIGVLEVINRKDDLPFTEDDSNLLEAFAGQAAVAIQNARLYTMTDQELSARVEELSVMQRIDRELNASLDVGRAMRITLDWALRQSGAEAGFIGVLIEDDTRLRIMAQDGYGEALAEYENAPMDIEQESLKLAIESGQPQKLLLDSSRQDLGYLATVRTQIVVPIKRETKVIGLFVLESSRELDDSVLEFLIRLSDHAAIAIANAQLFEAVERANAAKTEFISFVAHELKNPMTSIKGYTDLLAKGAVGPINEMQANFLKTISTNVERMSRLVSDLNDNSKIEAGRLHLDFSRVDINDIIEDAVRSLSQQMQEKEQTIEVQAPDNLPPVWADKTRISQVLVNLVSNAYKYTPRGGHIIVGAEVSENIWDPEGAEQVVHLWVKDNGIGIKPEDQKKIFQKFFRSDDEKARESPGTGLGLNITKGLVELQGGKIWFESEFRKGTTFHFTVPVATEKEA